MDEVLGEALEVDDLLLATRFSCSKKFEMISSSLERRTSFESTCLDFRGGGGGGFLLLLFVNVESVPAVVTSID